MEDIDHSKIKAKSPQTNVICERFNRTVQNKFYAIAFRKKSILPSNNLNTRMNSSNTQKTHFGKYCSRKTPMQTFIEGITLTRKYQVQNKEIIQPNDIDSISFSCGDEESYECAHSNIYSHNQSSWKTSILLKIHFIFPSYPGLLHMNNSPLPLPELSLKVLSP